MKSNLIQCNVEIQNIISYEILIVIQSLYRRYQSIDLDYLTMGKNSAQRGARTHDPEIKSLMLYRLS